MNQILSDPDDDTKGFFDPNTQENLTYLQLVERCVTDPITGLSLLVIAKKGEVYFFVDEATKLILKATTTTKAGEENQSTTVSLWDLLYSKYITEEKRRELVQQYKSGSITIERFLKIILTIIEPQTTTTSSSSIVMCQHQKDKWTAATSTITTTVKRQLKFKASMESEKTSQLTTTTSSSSIVMCQHQKDKWTAAQHYYHDYSHKDNWKFKASMESEKTSQLVSANHKIINEDLYNNLTAGNVTVTEVSEMVSAKVLRGN
ncbi:Epiplakin [Dissostichus eleginoides]|uniref:Epiplakin n=1 Tax=Dissostichus eleginoides TaxID=100907 RepID=A0AAD9BF87_DISEL|nr:Epiplakin [Dissostichus eleginoides]